MLCSLSPEAYSLVTPRFCDGQVEMYPHDVYEPYLEESSVEFDVEGLNAAVDKIIRSTEQFSPEIDAPAARELHQALPLSRREAAQPGFWRFLAVVQRPELIRHRWEARSFATMRQRFWSVGTRHTSNTFCRLWWIAELTVRDGSYELTPKACGNLAIPLFVRRLSHHPIAVEVIIEELHDATSGEIEGLMRKISHLLSTVVLESQSKEELRQWIRRLRALSVG